MAGGAGAAILSSENEPANEIAEHNVKRILLMLGFL
jgi:hypothetical protein